MKLAKSTPLIVLLIVFLLSPTSTKATEHKSYALPGTTIVPIKDKAANKKTPPARINRTERATIRAENLATGQEREARSDRIGGYRIPLLEPDLYRVAASADGFIADAGGGVGWLEAFNGVDTGYAGFIDGIDTVGTLRDSAGLGRESAVVDAVGAVFTLEGGIQPGILNR